MVFFSLLILFVLAGGFFAWNKVKGKEVLNRLHQNLPPIKIPQLNGDLLHLQGSLTNTANIVAYFNTTCHLCQSEAQLLVANFQDREDLNFIFISSQPAFEIREFKEHYKLDKLSNSIFLSDTLFQFANQFRLQGIPVTFAYDSKGKLVKEFFGTFKIQELKNAIDQTNGS
jgi:peroxiredoxin